MPVVRTQIMLSPRGRLLIRALERGTPFYAARSESGVSWWAVFAWCLNGRPWFHRGPVEATSASARFLVALPGRGGRCGATWA
jgi:hypothetical protein